MSDLALCYFISLTDATDALEETSIEIDEIRRAQIKNDNKSTFLVAHTTLARNFQRRHSNNRFSYSNNSSFRNGLGPSHLPHSVIEKGWKTSVSVLGQPSYRDQPHPQHHNSTPSNSFFFSKGLKSSRLRSESSSRWRNSYFYRRILLHTSTLWNNVAAIRATYAELSLLSRMGTWRTTTKTDNCYIGASFESFKRPLNAFNSWPYEWLIAFDYWSRPATIFTTIVFKTLFFHFDQNAAWLVY